MLPPAEHGGADREFLASQVVEQRVRELGAGADPELGVDLRQVRCDGLAASAAAGGSSGGTAIERLFTENGGRDVALFGVWLAVGTLAWHSVRLAARARRVERLTRAWRVAGSE